MEKIKVQNVRSGKISEITRIAWEQLKKGGHAKNFDVIENAPKKEIKFNVASPEPVQPVQPEQPVVEETEVQKPKAKTKKTTTQ
jgi:hypothetical protein